MSFCCECFNPGFWIADVRCCAPSLTITKDMRHLCFTSINVLNTTSCCHSVFQLMECPVENSATSPRHSCSSLSRCVLIWQLTLKCDFHFNSKVHFWIRVPGVKLLSLTHSMDIRFLLCLCLASCVMHFLLSHGLGSCPIIHLQNKNINSLTQLWLCSGIRIFPLDIVRSSSDLTEGRFH